MGSYTQKIIDVLTDNMSFKEHKFNNKQILICNITSMTTFIIAKSKKENKKKTE